MPKTAWVHRLSRSSSASTTTSSPATTSSAASPIRSRRGSTWTTCACRPRTCSSTLPARRSARGDPRVVVRRRDATRSTTPTSTRCTAPDHGTQIPFTAGRRRRRSSSTMIARAQSATVSGPPDLLNRCATPPCDRPGATAVERRAERALQPLTGVHGAVGRRAAGGRASCACAPTTGGTDARLLAGAQPRAHQRRVHVRRDSAARARRRHADRRARAARQLPELLLRRRRRADRGLHRALAAVTIRSTSPRWSSTWGVRRTSPSSGRRSTGSTPTSSGPADPVRPLRPRSLRQLLTPDASVEAQLEIGAPADAAEQPREAVE